MATVEDNKYEILDESPKLTFIDEYGEEIEAELLLSFRFKNSEKKYVIYTFNEKDKNGMITIYGAIYHEDGENNSFTLEKIVDTAEWNSVKEVLRLAIKKSGDK